MLKKLFCIKSYLFVFGSFLWIFVVSCGKNFEDLSQIKKDPVDAYQGLSSAWATQGNAMANVIRAQADYLRAQAAFLESQGVYEILSAQAQGIHIQNRILLLKFNKLAFDLREYKRRIREAENASKNFDIYIQNASKILSGRYSRTSLAYLNRLVEKIGGQEVIAAMSAEVKPLPANKFISNLGNIFNKNFPEEKGQYTSTTVGSLIGFMQRYDVRLANLYGEHHLSIINVYNALAVSSQKQLESLKQETQAYQLQAQQLDKEISDLYGKVAAADVRARLQAAINN